MKPTVMRLEDGEFYEVLRTIRENSFVSDATSSSEEKAKELAERIASNNDANCLYMYSSSGHIWCICKRIVTANFRDIIPGDGVALSAQKQWGYEIVESS
jgi:hypothetical protein